MRKQQLKTFLSFEAVVRGLDLSESENPNTLIPHIVPGLVREELIEDTFRYGGIDNVRKEIPDASAPGMVLTPSPLGIELYLWAYGKGDLTCEALLDRKCYIQATARNCVSRIGLTNRCSQPLTGEKICSMTTSTLNSAAQLGSVSG